MHGIMLIDKPAGPTSAEVVRLVKARLGRKSRVGHLGTLDPFATGVLPILVGEGTKLAPFLQEGEKEYCGLIVLGAETDTLDRTGAVVRTAAVPALDAARLNGLAAGFCGVIEQTPPIFSALKRAGVPLYKLARRGDEVAPPPPRRVEIKRLELAARRPASIRFTVVCSPGMYVRSLARDLGVALGSAAHLAELRRIRSGASQSRTRVRWTQALATLGGAGAAGANLIGMRDALADFRKSRSHWILGAPHSPRRRGCARRDRTVPAGAALFKVLHEGRLLAIASAEPPAGAPPGYGSSARDLAGLAARSTEASRMKIVRYTRDGREQYGALEGDRYRAAIEGALHALRKTAHAKSIPRGKVSLLAPVAPSKIVAAGLNYGQLVRDLKIEPPREPLVFI